MTLTRPTATVEIDFTTDLSAGLAYYEQVAASGPFMWHRLQETSGTSAADASGNGNTGTYAGTYTLNQTSGKPVSGETASRYILFGSAGRVEWNAPGDISNGRMTLEAWAYQATLSGSGATEYQIADSGAGLAFGLAVRGDGKLSVRVLRDGLSLSIVSSTAPITAATWYHVAVVVDAPNNTVIFVVNGATVTATAWTGQINLFNPLTGYWGAPVTRTSVSRIAEPALYLDLLDAGTLADHYNAAATAAFSDYSWTDVTAYLDDTAPMTRSFGRESDLADVTPMELTFTLLNKDRRFELEYTSSPYYPNVVPGRPCRVRLVQNSVTYDWAFGFIQDFPQEYPQGELFGKVPIVAHCFLERMHQDSLGTRRFLQHLAGSRMTQLCNIAGVPTSRRTLDAGVNQMMAQTVEGGSTGDHARLVANSDRGVFFFNGAGYAISQDGSYRTTNARSTASQGTLGFGNIEYTAPRFHAPASLIRNEIVLRRPGGVDQIARDGTSRRKYGWRSYPAELLLTTDALTATRAAALLADYKDPTLRIRAVTFNPQTGTGKWEHSLGVRISDRYTWEFDPLQGTTLTRPVFVEGVTDTYDIPSGEYLSTWFLSLV